MSSAHDAHGAASAHAHDDHDHFDNEPAKELSPGEPRSPAWLPAVGLAFFAGVAVYMLAGGDSTATPATPPAPLTPPAQLAPVAAPRPIAPRGDHAAPAGSGGMRKLTPEQVEELRKKIEEAKAKGILPRGGAPAH